MLWNLLRPVYGHEAIGEWCCLLIQFVMLAQLCDNENKRVIYRSLIIRIDYARMLLFVFGLLVC